MIISKPWGAEKVLVNNGRYVIKKIFVKEGHRLSLQYHKAKDETLLVWKGKVMLGTDIKGVGTIINIPHNTHHRIEALKDTVIYEVSTPELDDVVRLEDDYGRANDTSL
jgi:mannose-6-phosphate isomerase-like protein (cupin superfamily)